MNQKKLNPSEIDRQQTRILNGLTTAFNSPGLRESRLLVSEATAELENYEKKVYQVEQPTVISVIQGMYNLSMARFDDDVDTEILQDMFFSDIETLVELLGIELKE